MGEIGALLWRASFGERRAIGIFGRLRRGQLLTAEERAPLERMMDEEVGHGNLLRACAKRYLPARIEIPTTTIMLYPAHRTPEHQLVAFIHAAERYETPGMKLAHRMFRQLGDTETAAVYERLMAEEPSHIAWSRSVLCRLRAAGMAGDPAAVRRPVIAAYKVARRTRWFLRDVAAGASWS
jgi:hypothetical protein